MNFLKAICCILFFTYSFHAVSCGTNDSDRILAKIATKREVKVVRQKPQPVLKIFIEGVPRSIRNLLHKRLGIVDLETQQRLTPLLKFLFGDEFSIVDWEISNGPEVLLYFAVLYDENDLIKTVIERTGITPFYAAFQEHYDESSGDDASCDFDMIDREEANRSSGADWRLTSLCVESPFHVAVRQKNETIVRYFLGLREFIKSESHIEALSARKNMRGESLSTTIKENGFAAYDQIVSEVTRSLKPNS